MAHGWFMHEFMHVLMSKSCKGKKGFVNENSLRIRNMLRLRRHISAVVFKLRLPISILASNRMD